MSTITVWLNFEIEGVDFAAELTAACQAADVTPVLSGDEIALIRANIENNLEAVFEPLSAPFYFTQTKPTEGTYETVRFGGGEGTEDIGSGPLDWLNSIPGQVAQVFTRNFGDYIAEADTLGQRVVGTTDRPTGRRSGRC